MRIDNIAAKGEGAVKAHLASIEDAEVLAQELTQKGALHALETLQRIGVSAANVHQMLDDLRTFGLWISAECKRRGLPTVEHPSGN